MGHFLWIIFFFLFLTFSSVSSETETYIVRVQNELKPSAFSSVEHWYKSTLRNLDSEFSNLQNSEQTFDSLEPEYNNDNLLHIYNSVFHGFSAKLTIQQVQQLKTRPEIVSIIPDRLRQLHTTRSPIFLGLGGKNPTNLLAESDSGSNVIIGFFDTGIWPERRSFHDEGLGPIPSHWKGECVEGERFQKSHCNKKIIGARFFINGYRAQMKQINITGEVISARDSEGHGTHTASTAAGRYVGNASLLGLASGVAVGVAPKARIAVYKICWKKGCADSDILAAFDAATADGVDVISISVGGGAVPYHLDSISIGSYGAMQKGIIISASAGNDGPTLESVANVAPWIITVGASTIDRKFPANMKLGNGETITGASLCTSGSLSNVPIIYAGDASIERGGLGNVLAARVCAPNSLVKTKVSGKIVICNRGGASRAMKGETVKNAGGVGVIVANLETTGEGLVADSHIIPGLSVTWLTNEKLGRYINSTRNPTASMVFHGTEVGVKPAPIVASFSARGPNAESRYVLKPDIIAPGVNILAAWPDNLSPTELPSDMRRTNFNILSGTSMSCPHVSGLVALLKGAHPDWSPAMIKSALMTTAYTQDGLGRPLLDEKTYNVSTIWGHGAGHVNPQKAVDPGLVYDLTADDYLNFLCASNYSQLPLKLISKSPLRCNKIQRKPWDLNYPAIVVAFEESGSSSEFEITVTRTVTHVSDGASTYTVNITNPKDVIVTVDSPKLIFMLKGDKRTYSVRVSSKRRGIKAGMMASEVGMLTWSDKNHVVNTPVVVVYQNSYF